MEIKQLIMGFLSQAEGGKDEWMILRIIISVDS